MPGKPTRSHLGDKSTMVSANLPGNGLPIVPQIRQYSYRLPAHLGDKFRDYAKNNLNVSAEKLLQDLLKDFLADKTVNRTYD